MKRIVHFCVCMVFIRFGRGLTTQNDVADEQMSGADELLNIVD